MAVALLKEPPFPLPTELGPYRRADYDALPDEPRCELIFGRFYLSPSPTILHQIVVGALHRILDEIADESGGLTLQAPIDVVLADHSVVQPDVLYLSAARRGIGEDRLEGAPDLVVEVLSPRTIRRDRDEKLALYARSGVREYWIVEAIGRQIEFLVNREGRFVVALPSDGAYQSEALPEIELDLAAFWRRVEKKLGR
ncbi:MAG TPA: Uma2 family endonuclease [Thermoanaerobaculia bacterium]|nr:Uma2 family endonuclease [Thermoanaerobaculia bacterium]